MLKELFILWAVDVYFKDYSGLGRCFARKWAARCLQKKIIDTLQNAIFLLTINIFFPEYVVLFCFLLKLWWLFYTNDAKITRITISKEPSQINIRKYTSTITLYLIVTKIKITEIKKRINKTVIQFTENFIFRR